MRVCRFIKSLIFHLLDKLFIRKPNFVDGEMNFESNFRFYVFGFGATLCEGNEMIQRVLVTCPYEENIVNKTKTIPRVIIQFFENNQVVSSAQTCP